MRLCHVSNLQKVFSCGFLPQACALRWGAGVSQQPVGSFPGPAGPRGGALPAAGAQRGRLAALLQHGVMRPGWDQLLPAARLLHRVHLWLVRMSSPAGAHVVLQLRRIRTELNSKPCRPQVRYAGGWRGTGQRHEELLHGSVQCVTPFLPPSHIVSHRTSSTSAFTVWEEGSARNLGQAAKRGQHSSHLGKIPTISSRNLTFSSPQNWKQSLVGLRCLKHKSGRSLPVMDCKQSVGWKGELSTKFKWHYATKWTTLWRWGPPPNMFWGRFVS